MANPQKEKGHIGIANEIAEVLARTNLSGYESRYLWVLWRKTYGWNKKEDIIANKQFVELTGLSKQHIWRTQKLLIGRNIVAQNGYKLSFNKDYDQWKNPKNKRVAILGNQKKVAQNGYKVAQLGGHNRHYTKDTISKDNIAASNAAGKEIPEIIKLFEPVNPLIGKMYGNNSQRAAVDRMLKVFGRDKLEAMIKVLPEVNAKPYWPKSTTPCQLEANVPIYKAKNDEEKNKGRSIIKSAIIL